MLARRVRPEPSARPSASTPASPQGFVWREAQAGARAFSPGGDPMRLLAGGLRLADVLIVLSSSVIAYLLRHGFVALPLEVMSTTLLAAILTFNLMHLSGAYGRHLAAGIGEQIGNAAQAWTLLFVTLVLLGYLTKTSEDYSRAWSIAWYLLALLGFVAARLVVAARLRRWRQSGRLARTIAIVDLAGNGQELARELQAQGPDVRLVGIFSDSRGQHRASGIDDLIALSRLFRIDEVIVSTTGRQDLDALVRRLGTIPTNVRLCPELPELAVTPQDAGLVLGRPMLTVYRRPFMGWNSVAKRGEDLMLGTLLLAFLSPLMLLLALLIKLDSPGPVLFRQKRLGFNNNEFEVFKFRSMAHRPVAAEAAVPQARRDDPRVTRMGRILRRTSLDELPQLLNVLKGEMSLVGPRPHALVHNEQYAALIDDYLGRHRVQPGITGWAQVNGLRGETDTLDKMRRRVEHDLAYIDNWSIMLDLKILFLTLVLAPFDRNAY